MSVLRRAKLRTPDGTESIEYPLGVEAKNVEVANRENLSQRLARIDEDLEKNEEDIAAVSELAGTNKQNIGAAEVRIDALERRSASVEQKPYYFDTVANMKAYQELKVGDMAITLGYYEANDGGGAEYNIVDGDYTDDGGSYHKLNNGLFAELIIRTPLNIKQFGAKSDNDNFDNTDIINYLISNFRYLYIPVGNYNINSSIIINVSSVILDFSQGAVFSTKNNISLIKIGNTTRVENVVLNNVVLRGTNKTGIGLDIYKGGYHTIYNHLWISGFDKGIKTEEFDATQLNEFNELYIGQCNIAIDDSLGGLQACRFYGGRIEQNGKGILLASPNTEFIGSVIEGNTLYELCFTNTQSDKYSALRSYVSSGTFTNCYFEHLEDNNTVATILFGEESNSGWWGYANFMGCRVYTHDSNPVFKLNGNAISTSETEKTISIDNLNGNYTKLCDFSSAGADTRVYIFNIRENSYASSNFGSSSYWKMGGANSKFSLINADLIYNSSDNLVIRPKLINIPVSGTYRSINGAGTQPWSNNDAGAAPGSLYYNNGDARWYMRTSAKGDSDSQEKWAMLAPIYIGNGAPSGSKPTGFNFYVNKNNGDLWFGNFSTWTKIVGDNNNN